MSELREAAERIRQPRKDSNEFDGGYPDTTDGRRQSLYDHATLANAYLAEHHADDGVSDLDFTKELLESHGCRYRMEGNTLSFSAWGNGRLVKVECALWITKGNLRRLLAALKIEVKG